MPTELVKAVITENIEKDIAAAEGEVNYDFPENVAGFVDVMGEDVVYSNLKQQVKIKLQAGMRTHISKGMGSEALQAWADGWRPGLSRPKMSSVDKLVNAADKMSDDELSAMLAEIQKRRNG